MEIDITLGKWRTPKTTISAIKNQLFQRNICITFVT